MFKFCIGVLVPPKITNQSLEMLTGMEELRSHLFYTHGGPGTSPPPAVIYHRLWDAYRDFAFGQIKMLCTVSSNKTPTRWHFSLSTHIQAAGEGMVVFTCNSLQCDLRQFFCIDTIGKVSDLRGVGGELASMQPHHRFTKITLGQFADLCVRRSVHDNAAK